METNASSSDHHGDEDPRQADISVQRNSATNMALPPSDEFGPADTPGSRSNCPEAEEHEGDGEMDKDPMDGSCYCHDNNEDRLIKMAARGGTRFFRNSEARPKLTLLAERPVPVSSNDRASSNLAKSIMEADPETLGMPGGDSKKKASSMAAATVPGAVSVEGNPLKEAPPSFNANFGGKDAGTEKRVSYVKYWTDADGVDHQIMDHQEDENKGGRASRGQSMRSSVSSMPGAHREGGELIDPPADSSGFLSSLSDGDSKSSRSMMSERGSTLPLSLGTNDMAIANLVDEDEEQGNTEGLPQGEFVNMAAKQAQQEVQRWKMAFLLAICCVCLLLIVIVLVAALVMSSGKGGDNEDSNNGQPTVMPSGFPSQAPSSFSSYALTLLPEATIDRIQGNPSSPQAKAFDWLVEDGIYNPLLPDFRVVQRYSLATFYFATGGENWIKNTNWLNHNASECNWYSEVKKAIFLPPPALCNTDSRVEHLGLEKNNLGGNFPEEFFLLTSLKALAMGRNRIRGPFPTLISELPNLEGMWINDMADGGKVPTQLGVLQKLKVLSMGHNSHTGTLPTELGLLTNLVVIGFGENSELSGPLPPLSKLKKLQSLSLDRCAMSGTIPTELALIKNLRMLILGGNKLRGTLPSELGLLTRITVASVYTNQLTGTLPTELGRLKASTLLAFRGNNFTGTLPSELGSLTKLETSLGIQDNPRLGGPLPTELGLLTHLYFLSFENNNHTGPIPSELGRLTALGRLALGNNSLTGTVPATLEPLHNSLYHFDVEGNALLSGTLPEALCTVTGSCVPSIFRAPCTDSYSAMGCTELLCGCDCPCSESTNSTTASESTNITIGSESSTGATIDIFEFP